MTKAEIRNIYKNKRLELSDQLRKSYDQLILIQLQGLDLNAVRFLHIYISIQKFREPETLEYVSFLRRKYPQVSIVISKSDFQSHTLVNYLWDEELKMIENKWGILEPVDGIIIDENKIDLVLVPLLVADKFGNRVGYGKGFYDRFLSKCKPTVKKIGISYFEPVDKIDDIGDWDVPLDGLITPFGSFQFN